MAEKMRGVEELLDRHLVQQVDRRRTKVPVTSNFPSDNHADATL